MNKNQTEGGFFSHLTELRQRLIYSFIFLFILKESQFEGKGYNGAGNRIRRRQKHSGVCTMPYSPTGRPESFTVQGAKYV